MLPTAARDLLDLDMADAEALAVQGRIAEGYQVLARGRQRAESARTAGESWGELLVQCYQAAIDHYTVRFGPGPVA
jgi:hypothetical protein